MTETRRLLLLGGSLVCLLVVASTLPAADPRLDVGAERPVDGDNQSVERTPRATEAGVENDSDGSTGPEIRVSEPVDPGSETEIRLAGVEDPSDARITVDGEYAGQTDYNGELSIYVPDAREMTVTADVPSRSENVTRTVDIRTAATLRTSGPAIPGRTIELNATVGSEALSGAAVRIDGRQVATTDRDGQATVPLPETAGPVTIRVERAPVDGERTIQFAEPRLTLDSPLLFPGSLAAVTVTADGAPVERAPISVNGETVRGTGPDGEARIQLPIASQAHITTELGDKTATATVGNLYLRLTAVVVLIPGFIIGSVWTAGRLLAVIERTTDRGQRTLERGSAGGGGGADLFVLLGEMLDAFAGGLDNLAALLRQPLGPGGWSLSWPSISLPSLGALSVSLSRPSGGGLSRWFGAGDDPDPDVGLDSVAPIDSTPETASGRRAQIRAVWHAFLDRLGVENRSTLTAGQAARRAVSSGFRAESVGRLLAAFRAVEYGGREPTPERVAEVRALTEELLADDTDDEEGDQ